MYLANIKSGGGLSFNVFTTSKVTVGSLIGLVVCTKEVDPGPLSEWNVRYTLCWTVIKMGLEMLPKVRNSISMIASKDSSLLHLV